MSSKWCSSDGKQFVTFIYIYIHLENIYITNIYPFHIYVYKYGDNTGGDDDDVNGGGGGVDDDDDDVGDNEQN